MTARATPVTEAAPQKVQYRVTNWPEYDRALVRRGRLTIWFDEAFLHDRWRPAPTGQRGAPFQYSDTAIQAWLTLKAVFDWPDRMVEGPAGSIVPLMDLALPIPDPTLLSRRAKTLTAVIPRRSRRGPIDGVVDSTGLKVYGEGEWKVRPHRAGKRRTGRKTHWAVDADVKDVLAVEVTTKQWTDRQVLAGLLEQMDDPIGHVRGDGAPWAPDHPRTQALVAIAAQGLPAWKQAVGYHRHRIAENALYRFKQWFGDHLASRLFETQFTEVQVRVAALNVMTYLGMPVSVPCRVILS